MKQLHSTHLGRTSRTDGHCCLPKRERPRNSALPDWSLRWVRGLSGICLATSLIAAVVGCQQSGDQSMSSKREHKSEVAPIPTPNDVVDKMLDIAQLTADDVVYDLGCGDGRIVIAAAKKYGCKAIGYEIEPELVAKSRQNARAAGVDSLVTIAEQDIFQLDLSGATVVTLYLLPQMNERLVPQLEKLKPGSRVVAHDFGIRGYLPDQVVRMQSVDDDSPHAIFLWTIPLRPDPTHAPPAGEPPP